MGLTEKQQKNQVKKCIYIEVWCVSFVVTSGVTSIYRILDYVISLIFVYETQPSLSKAAVAIAQRNSKQTEQNIWSISMREQ